MLLFRVFLRKGNTAERNASYIVHSSCRFMREKSSSLDTFGFMNFISMRRSLCVRVLKLPFFMKSTKLMY
jgi:hypothetical protein